MATTASASSVLNCSWIRSEAAVSSAFCPCTGDSVSRDKSGMNTRNCGVNIKASTDWTCLDCKGERVARGELTPSRALLKTSCSLRLLARKFPSLGVLPRHIHGMIKVQHQSLAAIEKAQSEKI